MNLVSIPANPIPQGAVVGQIKARDGVSLRFARWQPPPGRKGTVCVFQGRAEFIEKYFEVVRELRQRGFAVVAFDWRGQGHSGRQVRNPRKGHVRRFADYRLDLDPLCRRKRGHLRSSHPGGALRRPGIRSGLVDLDCSRHLPSHSAIPVHRPARLAPGMCAAIVADDGNPLAPGGIRTNGAGSANGRS